MAAIRTMTILPFLAFAGMAGALGFGPRGEDPMFAAGYLDRPLPAFDPPPMSGTDKAFSSGDLAGRVVLLNVFSSWCASCRQEHPFLMKLAESGGVPIYGLNWKDAPGAGKVFLSDLGNPFVATAEDRGGEVGELLNVTGVPETYVVDAQGQVRYRHLGPITAVVWAETLRPLITQLEEES